MTKPGRQLIMRVMFALAIVASTATVGVVGFAQAAQPKAQLSGYGGGIPALMAALDEFRQSVRDATKQYRQDVNACLDGTKVAMNKHGALRAASAQEAQFDHAKGKFSEHVNATTDMLGARAGDQQKVQAGRNAFENNFNGALADTLGQINGATGQLATDLGPASTAAAQDGGLFQCLNTARDKYQTALQTARDKLIATIREIFGS